MIHACRNIYLFYIGLTAAALICAPISARAAEPAKPDSEAIAFFEAKVRPLLANKCFECHGGKKQESELRLDLHSGALKGGATGPAVVPFKPDESALIQAIRYDSDIQMPPDEKLSAEEIAVLTRWVSLGAPWPKDNAALAEEARAEQQRNHWAFQPIQNPTPPAVKDERFAANPVDRFILEKLAAAGLEPSPEADRRTLIRRATYDLTGLPPSAAEVDAFVTEAAPDAYEKLIDRLLASPHYGEQWARHWLDVARYSDTKGYVYGREEKYFVHAWPYRDWVVNAFNSDLPYDKFLLLQIAGDKVEGEPPESLAAMGFLTLGRRFLGNSHDIIDDRIDVLGRGTMGLSISCARCHDHKYDPIPTEDYYSLYGVFKSCTERLAPLGGDEAGPKKDDLFWAELDKRRKALNDFMESSRATAAERVRGQVSRYLTAQLELDKYPEEGFDTILSPKDLVPEFVRAWRDYLHRAASANPAIWKPWIDFAAIEDPRFGSADAKSRVEQITTSIANADVLNPLVRFAFATAPKSMREVAERYGALFDKVEKDWRAAVQEAGKNGNFASFDSDNAAAKELRQVLYAVGSPCVVPDEPIVTIDQFFDNGPRTKLWQLQGDVDRLLINTPQAPPYTLTLSDRALPYEPVVFKRGDPQRRGENVARRFLKIFGGDDQKPFVNGSGRLELAKATIDPSNPLTARVWVNRVWMHHFGEGLVRTPSDFGLRAESPSHPELLDWLASKLIHEGWSTKAIHREIMLSQTYRQSSSGTDDATFAKATRVDPDNRLLWRMNARRLSFEELRDTMLAATGELDLTMGGRPVKLFDANKPSPRRAIYGVVDRQLVPDAMRTFDFASPDLHIPKRAETSVPQQALFALNDPFVGDRSRRFGAALKEECDTRAVARLYQDTLQRLPIDRERDAALEFLRTAAAAPNEGPTPESLAWSYGFGAVNEASGRLDNFTKLPHFTGDSWQGSAVWPDAKLGWVRVTSEGGHAGNDAAHAAVRRWTAATDGAVSIDSLAMHDVPGGDGVRCWVISSRHGVLKKAIVHNKQEPFKFESLDVKKGDTIDFVTDFNANLNSDQYVWIPRIEEKPITDLKSPEVAGASAPAKESDPASATHWDASRDFAGPTTVQLNPIEQLAQVLLISNEAMFVD